MKPRLMPLLAAAVFLTINAHPAAADPIQLIGGQLAETADPSGGRVIGPGLDVSFLTDVGGLPLFLPVGSLVDFSEHRGVLNSWGSPIVGGARVQGAGPSPGGDSVWIGGAFDISAVPVRANENFSAPFSLTGRLMGWATADESSPPLFSIDVTGSGTLQSGGIILNMPNPTVRVDAVAFRLDDPSSAPSPTPEPGTWLLLAMGAAVVGVRARGLWARS
jgi:hypothetical protein